MKSEYAAVLEGATVEEAIEIVRTLAEAVADIHNVLVVDHQFHLLGVLPLARLILARAGETVDAVMDRPVEVPTWAAEPELPATAVSPREEAIADLLRGVDATTLVKLTDDTAADDQR